MKLANQFFKTLSMRNARLAVATVGLLTLFVFTPATFFQTEAVTNVGKMPKEAVAQIKLITVDGQQFSLASLRGKVVVLDFFGMRCAHSRDHIKETMTQFSEEQISKGLQLIGIESESSSANQVREYIQAQKLNYPVAQIDEPTFIQFVNSRDLSAPQTLVFGRDGKLLLHTNGHSAQNEAAIRAAVQKALDKQ
ncbi:MAG: TlpA family protein disulfide reductase [Blastocatellia bacterium]|nr:TlpA family protein disulfide reductase [Blastocatellia bacterium]